MTDLHTITEKLSKHSLSYWGFWILQLGLAINVIPSFWHLRRWDGGYYTPEIICALLVEAVLFMYLISSRVSKLEDKLKHIGIE